MQKPHECARPVVNEVLAIPDRRELVVRVAQDLNALVILRGWKATLPKPVHGWLLRRGVAVRDVEEFVSLPVEGSECSRRAGKRELPTDHFGCVAPIHDLSPILGSSQVDR